MPRQISDPITDRKPSLRISHIVYGRESRVTNGVTRVYYLSDPNGLESKKMIPEEIVLHRWRKRVFKGFTFSGVRLSPHLWRGVQTVFGTDCNYTLCLSEEQISLALERAHAELKANFFRLPPAEVLHALFRVVGPKKLGLILARHNDPDRAKKFGTPDLFLFATEISTGHPSIARFVEVKKPEEPLSRDQREEIAFLQSLDLHARVLRLTERTNAV
jgi:hypothetical protein